MTGNGYISAVHLDSEHRFSKVPAPSIRLLAGFGVEGDAHGGARVQHRSRVRRDPTQPNLRQVHLIHVELFEHLGASGYDVAPGQLGENITTVGLDLLGLPRGTLLHLGPEAVVEITGLRNPCSQLDDFQDGLLGRLAYRDGNGELIRLAGIMGVVLTGGEVRPTDQIRVVLPVGAHIPLDRV